MEISYTAVGATRDSIRQPVNWGLLVSLLGCVVFWSAVVSSIVAVF